MNKRERVLNAMNLKPVDHVPVGFWFHFSGEEAKGDACVEAHLKYYRETDLDFLKVMDDGYGAFPCDVEINTADDWYKLKPISEDHPYYVDQVYRARKIVEAIGEERCVFYNVFSPFCALRNIKSDAVIMQHIKENPNAVLHALDVIAQGQVVLVEKIIREAGCDGIYYPVQGAEYGRFTVEEYNKYVRPSDLYVLERANRLSENNILHCCGWAGKGNQVEVWKDYPSKVVNWAVYVEKLPLEEGRYLFGRRACLGGFETLWNGQHQQGIIYDGTKEELEEYTRNLILSFGKTGLILGGDCTVSGNIVWDNIRNVVNAARSI